MLIVRNDTNLVFVFVQMIVLYGTIEYKQLMNHMIFIPQATLEKLDTTELQNNNRQILCNILPAHVAAHFVEVCHRSTMVSLYSFMELTHIKCP